MNLQVLSENRSQLDAAQQRIDSFLRRFGEAHFTFACHAAFPIALTPELLYAIWANFQQDSHRNALDIPWIAVSDFLLSGLCDEAGQELYAMEQTTRDSLLHALEESASLGQLRIQQLAQFLETHAKPKLQSDDPDIRDWAQAQRWTALAYQKPEVAAKELTIALSNTYKHDQADLIRITNLIEALQNPLAEFKELIAYARGMAAYAHGDLEAADYQFRTIYQMGNQEILLEASIPEIRKTTNAKSSRSGILKVLIKQATKNIKRQSLTLQKATQRHWSILVATPIILVFVGLISGGESNNLKTALDVFNIESISPWFNQFPKLQPKPSSETTGNRNAAASSSSGDSNMFAVNESDLDTANSNESTAIQNSEDNISSSTPEIPSGSSLTTTLANEPAPNTVNSSDSTAIQGSEKNGNDNISPSTQEIPSGNSSTTALANELDPNIVNSSESIATQSSENNDNSNIFSTSQETVLRYSASITEIRGSVNISRSSAPFPMQARVGNQLRRDDIINVGFDSYVTITCPDGLVVQTNGVVTYSIDSMCSNPSSIPGVLIFR